MALDSRLVETLWDAAKFYNEPRFIEDDPILIPHLFTNERDIELAGFFTALIAWGQRKTIISNAKELMRRMDNSPYEFILNATEGDRRSLDGFVHRTFNDVDLIFLVNRLGGLLKDSQTLENLFFYDSTQTVEKALIDFRKKLFSNSSDSNRTLKHVATPEKNSACKRLNMYLRWMVRPNDGVDFGIWKSVNPSILKMPLDTHVIRVVQELDILSDLKGDWKGCLQLTDIFSQIHPFDPVFFDFALFGMGVNNRNIS